MFFEAAKAPCTRYHGTNQAWSTTYLLSCWAAAFASLSEPVWMVFSHASICGSCTWNGLNVAVGEISNCATCQAVGSSWSWNTDAGNFGARISAIALLSGVET